MFSNKILIIAASLFLVAGSVYAATKTLLQLPPLESTSDTGVVLPAADNTVDLGSSSVEFQDGYFDGTVYTDAVSIAGDITSVGDIRVTGFLGNAVQDVNMSTAGALTITSGFVVISTTNTETSNNITPAAKPFLTLSNLSVGDYVVFTVTTTAGVVFTEGSAEQLQLGAATRTINQYDTLFCVYQTSGTGLAQSWLQEVSFVDN